MNTAVITEIAEMGKLASSRGWVPATSGNFSRRIDEGHIAITRSGVDKGTLCAEDIVVLSLEEPIPPGVSAETPLHAARYRTDHRIGAVMHVHSVAATVLSRACEAAGFLELRGFEMQKALKGVTTHESVLRLAVFANSQDTAALSRLIESALPAEGVPGYLLAGHGMYAWGSDAAEARRHTEGLEFLLRCALQERRLAR
ncbi:MAG: methylthioribulose 1-phosphate dehydratase [Candidatus Baltobacteraceae bacterium]